MDRAAKVSEVEPEFRCPKCSGTDLRRTMPRNGRERLIRSVLPMHLYFCRTCERRSWIWGATPRVRARGASTGASGGRTLEPRDRALARRNRNRVVKSAVFALLLGVAFGIYLKGCQERHERFDRSAELDHGP